MIANLRHLLPSPLAIAGLLGLLWSVSSGAVRDFVWADLRDGLLDLRPMPRNARLLARAGLVLFALVIIAMLFGDFWRSHASLIPLPEMRGVRPQLLPALLLPVTLFLLVVAWSFVLTGALHSHWALRLGFLLLYILTAIGWVNSILVSRDGSRLHVWAAVGALSGVVLFFALRWRSQARPALEFSILFAFVAVVFLLAQAQEVESQRKFGLPVALAKLSFNVNHLSGLITPLLLLIGMSIADFTRRASHWAADIILLRAPGWTAPAVLLVVAVWRGYIAVLETVDYAAKSSPRELWLGYLGAFGEVAVVALVWWLFAWLNRTAGSRLNEDKLADAAEGSARPLVLAFSAVQVITFLVLAALMALPGRVAFDAIRNPLFALVDVLSGQVTAHWQLLMSAGGVAAAAWLARRGRNALALYLGTFGALQIWWHFTSRGNVLEMLGWRGQSPVEFWWVTICFAAAVCWLARRTLTPERIGRLIVILLVVSLMRQRDFIENPFTPIFGFAGTAFIAFGLAWDISTCGSWTNGTSPAIPRLSRIFLYLGFVLITATALNWAVTTHDLDSVEKFAGDAALLGFDRFGKPLLYSTFAILLALPPVANTSATEAADPNDSRG